MMMNDTQFEFVSARSRGTSVSQDGNKRAQQRGIDEAAVPLLLAYGRREFDGKGGIRDLMTSDSLNTLSRADGRTPQVEALAGL